MRSAVAHKTETRPNIMDCKIVVITTLRNGSASLLPHWIEHYNRLGVDQIILSINLEMCSLPLIPRSSTPILIFQYKNKEALTSDSIKDKFEENALNLAQIKIDDWVLRVDLDEFQEYPNNLKVLLSETSEFAVQGKLIERITEDGSMPKVEPNTSIFKQFPYSGYIVREMGGCISKVVASKRSIILQDGRHWTRQAIAVKDVGCIVHHFKFRGELIERLAEMLPIFGQDHWFTTPHLPILREGKIPEKWFKNCNKYFSGQVKYHD